MATSKRKFILRQVVAFGTMLLVDVGIPLALYYILKMYTSILIALIVSGIPPLLRVIYIFWRRRKVDVLGCIIVFSFVLSAILSIISGDVRAMLLRDSATMAIIATMFLVTLIPIKTRWFVNRPLTFCIAQQMMSELPSVRWKDEQGQEQSLALIEWLWQEIRRFRVDSYILTALWGLGLMGEFAAKVIMIESNLDVDHIVLYGNIIQIVLFVSLTTLSIVNSLMMRKYTAQRFIEWREKYEMIDE
ncbi:uncharacterized protein BYT42DRAFT_499774 [Radiomyces spectabilis]|uniref:uncharacterized protein n=1 Tax=Radiomyces spectabilis TaxID=64574 RepID=UPI002221283E|nr:uncharacterized protein BYT42DRAFT_499774 [Radiomyces spectabilis]KAI8374434.1 hypothetical protein BYT42DRAFT_499774 [Radiomyces spectabilis]